MTALKRHFHKTLPTDFSEILMEDVKSMLNTVLRFSCRYLPSLLFFSYRESQGSGQTPAGRVLELFKAQWKIVTYSPILPYSSYWNQPQPGIFLLDVPLSPTPHIHAAFPSPVARDSPRIGSIVTLTFSGTPGSRACLTQYGPTGIEAVR